MTDFVIVNDTDFEIHIHLSYAVFVSGLGTSVHCIQLLFFVLLIRVTRQKNTPLVIVYNSFHGFSFSKKNTLRHS